MEDSCEFLKTCPIFEKSKMGAVTGAFIFLYCEGPKMADCERRKLKKEGQEVPLSLLPNGEFYNPNR
jgi:hypothetical protein